MLPHNTLPAEAGTNAIHPEIPAPEWATDRYLDDDGRVVVDEHRFSVGEFDVELASSHTFGFHGRAVFDHGDNVSIWWDNVWSEGGTDHEYFTIFPDKIPGLIAALTAAHERFTNPQPPLRRSADVDEQLRSLDD